MDWGGLSYKSHVKMSKRCQMSKSQTCGLWRRFAEKEIDTMRSQILMSILTSHVTVVKINQKYLLWTFWVFLVTFICDVMCEPHYVNIFFVNLFYSSAIWFLDKFWEIWFKSKIWVVVYNLMQNNFMKSEINWI